MTDRTIQRQAHTIKHSIRRHESLTETQRYSSVTLPAIPGVTVDGDRSETEPNTKTIRTSHRRSLAGIALMGAAQRRVEWVREALKEVDRNEGL